jgi:probable HAF family extracellular repeat protein
MVVGTGDTRRGNTDPMGVPLFGADAHQWFDLGTFGGTWVGIAIGDGPYCSGISNTGMVVGQAMTTDGYMHAFAATPKSGMVDIGTLADIGYSGYNVSLATAVNESGTLIVGWSSSEWAGQDALPVVWTPKVVWGKHGPTTTWNIQKLDTTGFGQAYWWWALGVNDYGQITGTAYDLDTLTEPGVVWEAAPGNGWKITLLPTPAGYPHAHPVTINNMGEIAGRAASTDFSTAALPVFWSKKSPKGNSWKFTVLPNLPGRVWAEPYGINDLGDIVGESYNNTIDWYPLAARWSTKNPGLAKLLNVPGELSSVNAINNNGIAVGKYWQTLSSLPRMVAVGIR